MSHSEIKINKGVFPWAGKATLHSFLHIHHKTASTYVNDPAGWLWKMKVFVVKCADSVVEKTQQ